MLITAMGDERIATSVRDHLSKEVRIQGEWFELLEIGEKHVTIWLANHLKTVCKQLVEGYRMA